MIGHYHQEMGRGRRSGGSKNNSRTVATTQSGGPLDDLVAALEGAEGDYRVALQHALTEASEGSKEIISMDAGRAGRTYHPPMDLLMMALMAHITDDDAKRDELLQRARDLTVEHVATHKSHGLVMHRFERQDPRAAVAKAEWYRDHVTRLNDDPSLLDIEQQWAQFLAERVGRDRIITAAVEAPLARIVHAGTAPASPSVTDINRACEMMTAAFWPSEEAPVRNEGFAEKFSRLMAVRRVREEARTGRTPGSVCGEYLRDMELKDMLAFAGKDFDEFHDTIRARVHGAGDELRFASETRYRPWTSSTDRPAVSPGTVREFIVGQVRGRYPSDGRVMRLVCDNSHDDINETIEWMEASGMDVRTRIAYLTSEREKNTLVYEVDARALVDGKAVDVKIHMDLGATKRRKDDARFADGLRSVTQRGLPTPKETVLGATTDDNDAPVPNTEPESAVTVGALTANVPPCPHAETQVVKFDELEITRCVRCREPIDRHFVTTAPGVAGQQQVLQALVAESLLGRRLIAAALGEPLPTKETLMEEALEAHAARLHRDRSPNPRRGLRDALTRR